MMASSLQLPFPFRSDWIIVGVCLLSRKRPGKLSCSQFLECERRADSRLTL